LLIFNGFSLGQGAGGEGEPPPAPSWNFDFTRVVFDSEYSDVAQQPGPPIVPAHRKLTSSTMRLEGGQITNVANITPRNYKINVFDSGSNLIYSRVFTYQSGGAMDSVDEPTNGMISPPVTIRVDLKSTANIWYVGTQVLTVGSATEQTTWSTRALPNMRVNTLTTWSYKIPTPNHVPNMRVGLYNIDTPNLPWEMFKVVWESPFNADSSFGWWREDNFLVNYKFQVGEPPNQGWRSYFMSGIIAKDEQPDGILYPYINYAPVGY
jgi:hypothetical protein